MFDLIFSLFFDERHQSKYELGEPSGKSDVLMFTQLEKSLESRKILELSEDRITLESCPFSPGDMCSE